MLWSASCNGWAGDAGRGGPRPRGALTILLTPSFFVLAVGVVLLLLDVVNDLKEDGVGVGDLERVFFRLSSGLMMSESSLAARSPWFTPKAVVSMADEAVPVNFAVFSIDLAALPYLISNTSEELRVGISDCSMRPTIGIFRGIRC